MHGKKIFSLSKKISALVFIAIILSVTAATTSAYLNFQSKAIEYQGQRALGMSDAIASYIDPVKFQNAIDEGIVNDYVKEVVEYCDRVYQKTDVEYLYITDNAPNGVNYSYFAESIDPSERDFSTVTMDVTDDIGEFPDEMNEALYTGVSGYSQPYPSDLYGTMLTGFTPILDSSGKVLGFAGVDISMQEVNASINSFGLSMLFFSLAASILFMICSMFVSKKMFGDPIKKLTEASSMIVDGNMGIQLDIKSNDEIGELAGSFKTLAATVSNLTLDINEMSRKQKEGEIDFFANPNRYSGEFCMVIENVNSAIKNYIAEEKEIIDILESFGGGDFGKPLRDFPGQQIYINEAVELLRQNLLYVNKNVNRLARAAAKGDLSKRLDTSKSSGDWKELIIGLNELIKNVELPITEASMVLNMVAEGNLHERVTGDYKGEFNDIKESLNNACDQFSSYIEEISESLSKLSAGDLRINITREYVGQFSMIKGAINEISKNLNKIMGNLNSSANDVAKGSSELSNAAGSLSSVSFEQITLVSDLTASVESIYEQTLKNSNDSSSVRDISQKSMMNVKIGIEEITKMLEAMDGIKESTNNINKIIKIIDEIARQTELLALNAAVEAANAGIHGRGFAIVAEQVRTLAGRSQKAVHDSAELIDISINNVENGAEIAQSTSESFRKITDDINLISELIGNVSASSENQSKSIEKITKSFTGLSDSSQKISTIAEESSALSEELANQATELKSMIDNFQLL